MDEKGNILHSYGIYAQPLPQAPTEYIHVLQQQEEALIAICRKLNQSNDEQVETALTKYFHPAHLIGKQPVQFHCGCSKEMFYGVLYAMNQQELAQYVTDQRSIEANCHICGKIYSFSPAEIKKAL
ncbi:redox-regulated HSP33 family molecular chaperone [Gracilibacillus alcaliphilus]|nr:redox-regulated HSP33 family molecular chaperone [Gracilibacillus alcaliphilus]